MTTTAIRKVPTDLPNARIYLDDLLEIENLLRDEFSKLFEASSISFEYAIDGAIAMTTHEELIQHGGYTTKFSLSVSSGSKFLSSGFLRIDGSSHPMFMVPYQLKENEWAVFGKVEQIFKTRKDKVKTFYESLPLFLLFCFWFLSSLLGSVAGPSASSSAFRPFATLYLTVQVIILAFMGSVLTGMFRKNRVYLHPIRQGERAREAIRKDRIEKLLWLIAGSIVGVLGTVVAEHLKH